MIVVRRLDKRGLHSVRVYAGVGKAAASFNGKEWTLYTIKVEASHRRKGVGGVMLDALIDALPSDAPPLDVIVERDNVPALALYESRGFVVVKHDPGNFIMERRVTDSPPRR
jgi:ribosomal protein S18 acetylase RimI-like enzyme